MRKIGYARVSTDTQNLDRQIGALCAERCHEVYREKASGKATKGRSQLEKAIDALGTGDVLMVSGWDRGARSMMDGVHMAHPCLLDLRRRTFEYGSYRPRYAPPCEAQRAVAFPRPLKAAAQSGTLAIRGWPATRGAHVAPSVKECVGSSQGIDNLGADQPAIEFQHVGAAVIAPVAGRHQMLALAIRIAQGQAGRSEHDSAQIRDVKRVQVG